MMMIVDRHSLVLVLFQVLKIYLCGIRTLHFRSRTCKREAAFERTSRNAAFRMTDKVARVFLVTRVIDVDARTRDIPRKPPTFDGPHKVPLGINLGLEVPKVPPVAKVKGIDFLLTELAKHLVVVKRERAIVRQGAIAKTRSGRPGAIRTLDGFRPIEAQARELRTEV